MPHRQVYEGACHCKNIAVRLESDKTPNELGTRTDRCSFCAKHHALYTADPAGAMSIAVADASLLQRYRFGTKTADFLVCRACGVFVAACTDDGSLAVVNINVLDARAEFLKNAVHVVDLDDETVEARLARRRARWTPVRSH